MTYEPKDDPIVPPTANDTPEQMEAFLKAHTADNTTKSAVEEAAIAQTRANLEARQLEEKKKAEEALASPTEG